MHLTAIATLHPQIDGRTVFTNPTMTRFLNRLFLSAQVQVRQEFEFSFVCSYGPSMQVLSLLLAFAPVSEVSLFSGHHLSRRVRGLHALERHSLVRLHPKFLSNVVSDFHLNQSTCLPVFCSKPHSHKDENIPFSLRRWYFTRLNTLHWELLVNNFCSVVVQLCLCLTINTR